MFLNVLVMKALTLRSKILGFSMECNDHLQVLGTTLDFATRSLSFFCHFYAIVWEIGEICRFLSNRKNTFRRKNFKPLDQIE